MLTIQQRVSVFQEDAFTFWQLKPGCIETEML